MERAQETRQRQGPASREPGPPLGPGGCGGRSRAQVEGVGWRSLQGHGRLVQEPTAWEPVRSQGRNAGGTAPLLLSGPTPKPVCLTSDFPRNPVQPSLPLCVHPMIQWEGGSLFLATQTAGPEPSIQVLVVKFLLEDQRQEVAGCTHRGDTDGLQWLWGVAE